MVSVCLAVFNGGDFLKDQLDSILLQLGPYDEVLIGDDGSDQPTLDVLSEYTDDRVLIFYNYFGEHVENFEFLLSKAQGDIIFLSDQDDVWASDKVAICKSHLKNDCYFVISNCTVTNRELRPIKESFLEGFDIEEISQYSLIEALFVMPPHYGCCMAFKKEILEVCLPFPKNIEAHDRWIGYATRLKYKIKYLPDRLVLFRRHDANVSAQGGSDIVITGESPYSIFDRGVRYAKLVWNLILRWFQMRGL
jgi:glycosyltransferase involved in cell wall biosynthesis